MTVLLENGRLLRDVLDRGDMLFDESGIQAVDPPRPLERTATEIRRMDVGGALVLPGIVDFHGDAFERSVAPRDGAEFPIPIAIRDADAQMVAAGITTGFLSPSLTWEHHRRLRTDEALSRFVDTFTDIRASLRCDTRLHLRFEIHHLDGEAIVQRLLDESVVDLLAFNDHLSYMLDRLSNRRSRAKMAFAFGANETQLEQIAAGLQERAPYAYAMVERLAGIAERHGIPTCAHDEEAPQTRAWYRALGSRISEFPVNRITAEAAVTAGDDVVLGAPNALKGGSLYDRLSVREAVKEGLCTVLASDYYYPSLVHAPFLMDSLGILSLADGWKLVSENPAKAVGLFDRGSLSVGKRADIIVVEPQRDGSVQVVATFVNGRLVHAAQPLH